MCKPDEGVVVWIKPRIEPQTVLIAEKWAREDASKWNKFWSARLNRLHSPLVIALIAGEEEGAVFADRPAELKAELLSLEKWIGVAWVPAETRISRQVVIPIKIEAATVMLIAPCARHDIDRAIRGHAGRDIEVDGRDLEFLHYIL